MPNRLPSHEPLRRRVMKRAAVATVVSAALLGVNERMSDDRVFHQERGNPANAADIVAPWAGRTKPPAEHAKDTDTYRAVQGDTAWKIAKKVEANQDGIAGDDAIEPIVDDISHQVGDQLDIGEPMQLPKDADLDAQQPGIQLDHK